MASKEAPDFYGNVRKQLKELEKAVDQLEKSRRPIDGLLEEEETLKKRKIQWEEERNRMEKAHEEELKRHYRQETSLKDGIKILEERISELQKRMDEQAKEDERRRGIHLTLPTEDDIEELFAVVSKDARMIVSNITKFVKKDGSSSPIGENEIFSLLGGILMEIASKAYNKVEKQLVQGLEKIFGRAPAKKFSDDSEKCVIVSDVAKTLLSAEPQGSTGKNASNATNKDYRPMVFSMEKMEITVEGLMKTQPKGERTYKKMKDICNTSDSLAWEVVDEKISEFVDHCCLFAWKWLIFPSKGNFISPAKDTPFQDTHHKKVGETERNGKLSVTRCQWPGLENMTGGCLVKAMVTVE